jgi:hypothetical protein
LGVRYVCRRSPSRRPMQRWRRNVPSGAGGELPEDLRRELADALVALDTTRIDALIGRVAERDAPPWRRCLRQHADSFDYGFRANTMKSL